MMLLDTHIWIRWLLPSHPLPKTVIEALQSEDILAVSAISCWEAILLHQRKRIELPVPFDEWLVEALSGSGVQAYLLHVKLLIMQASYPHIIKILRTGSSLQQLLHMIVNWRVLMKTFQRTWN